MGNGSGTGNSGTIICIVLAVVALLIIGAVVCFTSEKFKNIRKKKKDRFTSKKSDLAKLDVIAVISPGCGYCQKLLKMLEDAGETKNVNIIDMSKGLNPSDQKALDNMGFQGGVPFIRSITTKKNHPGCPSSLDALVKSLSTSAPTQGTKGPLVNQAKDLGIVFYGRESCPYCVRMKKMLEEDGLMEVIEFVDTGSSAGAKKLPKTVTGVPHFQSKKTKKTKTGATKTSSELLGALSGKEHFGNNDPIDDLQIIMYKSDSCGYCNKAKQMLGSHLDKIEMRDGAPPGVQGVPHFESKKTGKTHTGAPQSLNQLIQALSGTEGFSNTDSLSDIEMYFADFCGHCTRTKQMLQKAGALNEITLIDVTTPEGQDALKKAKGTGGIPHFRNTKNGKTHTGSVDSVQELKQKLA